MTKSKLVLIVLPLFVVVIGYMIYLDETGGNEGETLDGSGPVFIEKTEDKEYEGKLDMMEKKERSQKKAQIKKASAEEAQSFFKRAVSKEDPEELQDTVTQENQLEPEKESKPVEKKVVYIERNRPSKKEVKQEKPETEPVTQPKQRRRRRVGFNSQSNGSSQDVASSSQGSSGEIMAVVHREHKVKANEVVKLRVTKAGTINGVHIPENTYLDAITSYGSNRVFLEVSGFRVNGQFVSQELTAYSLTGGEGLEVNLDSSKGAAKDITKGIVGGVTQSNRVSSPVNPIGAGGTMAQNEIDETEIVLRSGTKVYLK